MSEGKKRVNFSKTAFHPREDGKIEVYFEYSVRKEGEYTGETQQKCFKKNVILTREEHNDLKNIITGRPEFDVDESASDEDIKSLIMKRI